MAKHQIIIMGRELESALLGVKRYAPDVVHLINNALTEDVYPPFASMIEGFVKIKTYMTDAYDAETIVKICEGIKAETLKDGSSLQYNITQGTKVEAAAAMYVANKYNDDVIYFSQEGEHFSFRDWSHGPFEEVISNEEFIRLYDNDLASYSEVSSMSPMDIVTARDVKNFLETYQRVYQKIQHQYRCQFGGRIEHLPESFKVDREKNMYVHIEDGGMQIVDHGKTLFSSKNPNTTLLFFSGRWWEVLVSDAVNKWDIRRRGKKSQVWRNVEFRGMHSGKTKNELDILVNDRFRMILIECKSGYLSQENVYKLDSTRTTYGGDHSKGVLVTYYPLDEDLVQKCVDLHVYHFSPATDRDRYRHLDSIGEFLDKVVKEIE